MNCAQFKESSWAYALGILDGDEQRAFEQHLAESIQHDGCPAELERALQTAAALGAAAPAVNPPRSAWGNIESRIGVGTRKRAAPEGLRRNWLPWALGFAAAACIVAAVTGVGYRNALIQANARLTKLSGVDAERQRCTEELNAMRKSSEMQREALALLELPATRVVALGPPPGAKTGSRGSVVFNPEEQKTMVLVSALAPALGKDYELWVIREKTAPIPAGTFKPGPDGRAIQQVPSDLGAHPGTVAITLEPEGGSPQPTSAPFLLASVEKT